MPRSLRSRWRSLDTRTRTALLAAALFALAVTAAIVTWWPTYAVQYVVQNVLPPSLWTLTGIGLAHWRQMAAHRAAHAEARAAREIAADTHFRITGDEHPAAPREGSPEPPR